MTFPPSKNALPRNLFLTAPAPLKTANLTRAEHLTLKIGAASALIALLVCCALLIRTDLGLWLPIAAAGLLGGQAARKRLSAGNPCTLRERLSKALFVITLPLLGLFAAVLRGHEGPGAAHVGPETAQTLLIAATLSSAALCGLLSEKDRLPKKGQASQP